MTPDTCSSDRVMYLLEEMRRLNVRVISRGGREYMQALVGGFVDYEELYEGAKEVPGTESLLSRVFPSDCEGID